MGEGHGKQALPQALKGWAGLGWGKLRPRGLAGGVHLQALACLLPLTMSEACASYQCTPLWAPGKSTCCPWLSNWAPGRRHGLGRADSAAPGGQMCSVPCASLGADLTPPSEDRGVCWAIHMPTMAVLRCPLDRCPLRVQLGGHLHLYRNV